MKSFGMDDCIEEELLGSLIQQKTENRNTRGLVLADLTKQIKSL